MHPHDPLECNGEGKYRRILENVRDFAIFSADLRGRIDEWNPGAARLFGYSEEEILGQPMEILYVPEDRVAGKAEMEKAVAALTGFSEDERWHLKKDGSRMFLSGMVNAMYDGEQKLCGYIKVARDITPRKLLADKLEKSEAYHRAILGAIEDFAIITLDTHGNIQSWNAGAIATYGYQPEEVLGKNHGLLFTNEDRSSGLPERKFNEAMAQGLSQFEQWFLGKNGQRVFLVGGYRSIRNGGIQPHNILHVSRDITHRHMVRLKLEETQKALEKSRTELEQIVQNRTAALRETVQSLESVLYHVAHDLRAPLRTMDGFASILVHKYSPTADQEAERITEMISSAAARMDRLIQDLLTYGRLCHEPVRRDWIPVTVVVQTVLSSLENEISAAEATVEVSPDLPQVLGDKCVFQKVISELISNALTFRDPARKLHIRIRSERAGDFSRLWIEDNGVGIPSEYLDRIFWLFEQLTKENASSTGMGLAIVRKAMERMGGQVGAQSILGQGTKFWLDLPAITKETK